MLIAPAAILFDMDGTLTAPLLDFARIKREMGIDNQPILESLAKMDEARRREAEAILLRHEDEAASQSTLNPGCRELLAWAGERRIAVGVITRNSRRCAEIVFRRHSLAFGVVITREDEKFKPDPAPVLLACRRLGVRPGDSWMVGDGQYDIEAGLAAGTKTIWVSHGRAKFFAAEPWRTVSDLVELTRLVCGITAVKDDVR